MTNEERQRDPQTPRTLWVLTAYSDDRSKLAYTWFAYGHTEDEVHRDNARKINVHQEAGRDILEIKNWPGGYVFGRESLIPGVEQRGLP